MPLIEKMTLGQLEEFAKLYAEEIWWLPNHVTECMQDLQEEVFKMLSEELAESYRLHGEEFWERYDKNRML